MANLSNIDNKFLVSTNGEVRIADTSIVADVKLRVKQTSQTWTAQFINTDSSVAYGISVDTSASSYGLAGTLQCYTNTGGGFIVRNDGNVGIGVTAPLGKLHIQTASTGQTPYAQTNQLVIENTGNSGIQFLAGTTSYTGMFFGDSGSPTRGQLYYNNNDDSFTMITSATTGSGIFINSSGNIGIGTDSPTSPTSVGTFLEIRGKNGVGGGTAGIVLKDYDNDAWDIWSSGGGLYSRYNNTVHGWQITAVGDVQAGRARSNTAGEVALSLQPSDSTIHYGWRIDSSTNSFNFDRVDSAGNLMTITSGGNVGIGTTVPGNFDGMGLPLVVGDGSGNSGITIFCGSNAGDYGSILFADASSGSGRYKGKISYEQNNEKMSFWTNETQRMLIDINGNVGIGVTPNAWYSAY